MIAAWLHRWFLPEHDRRLLPEGRVHGPMPWVIAIMMFLTVLACAGGIAVARLALGFDAELAGRVTVQVTAANPARQTQEADAAIATLRASPLLTEVTPVAEAEARALIEPWLGEHGLGEEFPVPRLIDARLRDPSKGDAALAQLRRDVRAVAPSAMIETQAAAAPLSALMRGLALLAIALIAMLAFATSAVVILAVRGALNSHRLVIDIVHQLGGSDMQIARLFQRRIMLDALFGGLIGLIVAVLVLLLVGRQIDLSGFGLFSGPALPWWGWIVLAILPFAGAGLANGVARMTVHRVLRATV